MFFIIIFYHNHRQRGELFLQRMDVEAEYERTFSCNGSIPIGNASDLFEKKTLQYKKIYIKKAVIRKNRIRKKL